MNKEEHEKKEILKRYRNLLRVWNTGRTAKDTRLVRKAFNLAVDAHKDMRRQTGEPYIYHPLEVARVVAGEIGLGTTSIACALLHDVVEDTDYTHNDIKTQFGEKIAKIVDGLTKIEEIFDYNTSSLQAENFKKMLLTISDDMRVILIKLADRLHNMRTLDVLPRQKQLKIASETHYLYTPLAMRLGLYSIKNELEDLSLKYTEPDIFETIFEKIKDNEKSNPAFVRNFMIPVKKDLKEQNISYRIKIENKSVSSIWRKMKSEEIPFEEVHDRFSVQFIIDSADNNEKVDCWRVYSIITDHYKPNIEKLRDWISIPKVNGYEALHATVMSKTGRWVDIQIRSERMQGIAEKGYVVFLKNKTKNHSESSMDEWLNKIREALKTEENSALDFVSSFKMNLFSDEIYVFTPKGQMLSLPKGSTALDFAYNIHTQIGNESIGAKANYKLVPLNFRLKSGDQVEIITSKKQVPKEEWFDFVVTARAKSRIKDALKDYRKTFKQQGKEKLNKIFNQLNIEFSGGNIQKLQKKIDVTSSIDLYYGVSQSTIGIKEIKNALHNEDKGWFRYIRRPFGKGNKTLSESIRQKVHEQPESLILDGDITKIDYVISSCCNPIPGDDVVGFVFKNKPIEIHHTNCSRAIELMSKHAGRMIKTKWRRKETISFLAGIKISAIDQIGFINEITNLISKKHKLNIRSFHLESSEGLIEGIILVYVPDLQVLNELILNLKKFKPIKKVSRVKRLSESSV